MMLKYFYDQTLAHASYLVACAASGEALVIDPMRNVEPYLAYAAGEGLRITQVTETHIHADFVSGVRELAARTGAQIMLSDMGDADWKYAYAAADGARLVRDGDGWRLGKVAVEVVATPGHTPEHIAFLITDTAGADAPMGLFSGDFLFVGDVGRPDLLETAAGQAGTKERGASQQFQSLSRVRALQDFLQVWPAHGAGSACGKALGAVPSSTLGYEKRFNPAFRYDDEAAFVDWLLTGQPAAPRYFAQMKRVNQAGPALLRELAEPTTLARGELEAVLAVGGQVFDLRSQAEYNAGHLAGSLSVPATATMYSSSLGWFVDYDAPCYLVLPAGADPAQTLVDLRAIGVDRIPGYLPAAALSGPGLARQLTASLAELEAALGDGSRAILDVRGQGEYEEQHLAGALHIPLGRLPHELAAIPADKPVIVHCASGYRAQIATSLLRRLGRSEAMALVDPEGRWRELAHVTPR